MPVPYFEGADFKSDIGFQKFRAQILKFGHLGPKSINFSDLNKILHEPYLGRAYFKSDIGFPKF